jgi:fatty acid desaturase
MLSEDSSTSLAGFTSLSLQENSKTTNIRYSAGKNRFNFILQDCFIFKQKKQSRVMLLAGIFFHLLILAASALTHHWLFALAWVLGFGIFFPFFATIRQVLEHRDELAHHATDFYKQPHGKVSRLFVHSLISSSFGSAGFTRHLVHHWDPLISYTRLKDIEDFLSESERTTAIISQSKTTYGSVLKKLLAAP